MSDHNPDWAIPMVAVLRDKFSADITLLAKLIDVHGDEVKLGNDTVLAITSAFSNAGFTIGVNDGITINCKANDHCGIYIDEFGYFSYFN